LRAFDEGFQSHVLHTALRHWRKALPHRLAGTRYNNSTVRVVPEIGIFSGVSNLTTFTGSHDGSG
jgi:hypothetical protein